MEETYMSVFKKFRICALLVMAAVTAIVANNFDGLVGAQTNKATVSGKVTDERGAVVVNAKIIARNLDTNLSRETTTDGGGRYRIPELPAGRYEVTAESQGFRPRIHRGIELTVGREVVVDFLLNVGIFRRGTRRVAERPLLRSHARLSSQLCGRRRRNVDFGGADLEGEAGQGAGDTQHMMRRWRV
jgi:hypothetical protein